MHKMDIDNPTDCHIDTYAYNSSTAIVTHNCYVHERLLYTRFVRLSTESAQSILFEMEEGLAQSKGSFSMSIQIKLRRKFC